MPGIKKPEVIPMLTEEEKKYLDLLAKKPYGGMAKNYKKPLYLLWVADNGIVFLLRQIKQKLQIITNLNINEK